MTIPEKAVEWAVGIANDNSHGYDQSGRWGPDYDCSSLVITAFKKAGLPLTSTYTGNMRSDFFNNGFAIASVNLATGEGLKVGDVLLNEVHHTALYIGNGKIVQASINEKGGITGGQTGDQTGNEIHVRSYYNYPWDYVLRYVRKDEPTPEPTPDKPGTKYTVVRGDTLWGIAERFLGSGDKYPVIMSANNLIDTVIHPGQELYIPSDSHTVYHTIQVTITHDTYTLLTIMAEGNDLTIGQVIDKLMEDAV